MTDLSQGFPADTFARRRRQVMEGLQDALLILPAAPVLHRSRDTEVRYRPDSELFYLTGITDPGVVAVFGVGDGGEELGDGFALFVPERDPKVELWSGPRLGPEETGDRHGASAAFPLGEMESRIGTLLKEPRNLFFRLGSNPDLDRLAVEAMREARTRGTRKGKGVRVLTDPGVLLDPLRMRKDPAELEALRRAAGLTMDGFREAMAGTRPGQGEWVVESLLEGAFRRGGGTGPAFPTIVASGANACVLHYSANRGVMGSGSLVLLDAGAEAGMYAGDVTRTFPVEGSFQGPQEAVYQVVLAAQRAALAQVRPGTPVSAVHEAATATLTEGLLDLGVLSGNQDTLLEEKAWEPFFPHQTSHWLGLDVHDVGDYARGGESMVLEPGMVLTVEPGLYFSPEDEAAPEAFRGIGVRIEDDLVVTEQGADNLTEGLPTSPEEVAALVGSR